MKNGYSQVLGPCSHMVKSIRGGKVGPRTLVEFEERTNICVHASPRTMLSYVKYLLILTRIVLGPCCQQINLY